MSKIKAQTLKGFRDFLPEEARKRQYVIDTLRKVFESYGFEPLETPALEYAETLTDKYGKEADKLIYLFKDRGGREIGLRYDLTVPLARVVAQYQDELPIPFKRYQIGPVWRADNPQKGRYREFVQADIDVVGSPSLLADAQVIACVLGSARMLGLEGEVKLFINDRAFLDSLGITPEIAIIVDKQDKVGKEGVAKELEKKVGKEKAKRILDNLANAKEPASIKQIREWAAADPRETPFSPWLSRGLEYYTGPIFELRARTGGLSIGGGGRYDKLISSLANRSLPATGFSFGIDRVVEALEAAGPSPNAEVPKALVTIFSKDLASQSIATAGLLQAFGIPTELYLDEQAKLDKQLKYANKRGIPFVVVIGPEEAKAGTATIKDMQTGEQKTIKQEDLPNELK